METNIQQTTNTQLLSIRDLRVWFELRRWGFGVAGHVRAVDGVSFDLPQGEAIAVVGESGCGKSSLMKTILGLYKPTGGSVIFDGDDIVAVVRTAYDDGGDGAHNNHDANFLTFHRWKNFRKLTMADSVGPLSILRSK